MPKTEEFSYSLRNVFLTNIKNFFTSSHVILLSFWKSKGVGLPEPHNIVLRNVRIEMLSWKLLPWVLGVPEGKSLQRTWSLSSGKGGWCGRGRLETLNGKCEFLPRPQRSLHFIPAPAVPSGVAGLLLSPTHPWLRTGRNI